MCEKSCLQRGVKSKYDDAICYWHKEITVQDALSAHVNHFCRAVKDLFQKIVKDHSQYTFVISK